MSQAPRFELLKNISRISFYLDDLRLFLDTHPDCEEAILEHNKCSCVRDELVQEYLEAYGPLRYYDCNNCEQEWKWVEYPWPWEGACD